MIECPSVLPVQWKMKKLLILVLLCSLGLRIGSSQTQLHVSTATQVPNAPSPAASVDGPSDDFQGTVLNACKWDNASRSVGKVEQDGELVLSTAADPSFSGATVFTQYLFLGDFDVQVDFRLTTGWQDPISPSANNPHIEAVIGIYADEPHRAHMTRMLDPGGDALGVYSPLPGQGMLARIPTRAMDGKFRVARVGSAVTFKYDTGQGWKDLYTVSGYSAPLSVYFATSAIATARLVTTRFDNFIVNSGSTSYKPLVWKDDFQRRGDFGVGGVLCDYLAQQVWGAYWKQVSPVQVLKDNGFTWVRAGLTTVSSRFLRGTPFPQWRGLGWRDEYWSSLEYTEQIFRESVQRGLRLYLFFFLSNTAAHAGIQNAPPEWASLGVADLTRALEDYTFATTNYFLDRGLKVELYEIGNEIEYGILNYRPGDRVAVPPGTDITTNIDFLKENVWKTEALLLKGAIAGVRRANPGAKIVLHIAGVGGTPGDLFVRSFFRTMIDQGVDFDYAGLSHPYHLAGWPLPRYSRNCWFQRLQHVADAIAAMGKRVIFSEAAYPHDPPGTPGDAMPDYPYTPSGQAAWVRDQLRFASNNQNVAGFFYFYPEYFLGVSRIEEQYSGLFATDNQVMLAMEEFRVNLPTQVARGGTVNAASYAANVAPGSLISIFGEKLANSVEAAAAVPLPTVLGSVSVAINGRPAPLLFVSPGQINLQVPFETSPGTTMATVTVGGSTSYPASFVVVPAAPGIFLWGANRAAAQNEDGSINRPDHPARSGSIVVVYLTGQGLVDKPVQSGAAAPLDPLARPLLLASATVGGKQAEILFLGLAPGLVGVAQANLRLPTLPTGDFPVTVAIGGMASNAGLVAVTGN